MSTREYEPVPERGSIFSSGATGRPVSPSSVRSSDWGNIDESLEAPPSEMEADLDNFADAWLMGSSNDALREHMQNLLTYQSQTVVTDQKISIQNIIADQGRAIVPAIITVLTVLAKDRETYGQYQRLNTPPASGDTFGSVAVGGCIAAQSGSSITTQNGRDYTDAKIGDNQMSAMHLAICRAMQGPLSQMADTMDQVFGNDQDPSNASLTNGTLMKICYQFYLWTRAGRLGKGIGRVARENGWSGQDMMLMGEFGRGINAGSMKIEASSFYQKYAVANSKPSLSSDDGYFPGLNKKAYEEVFGETCTPLGCIAAQIHINRLEICQGTAFCHIDGQPMNWAQLRERAKSSGKLKACRLRFVGAIGMWQSGVDWNKACMDSFKFTGSEVS